MPTSTWIDFEGQLTSTNMTHFTLTLDSPMQAQFTTLVFRYIFFIDNYASDGVNLVMGFVRLNAGGVEINNSTTEYWVNHTVALSNTTGNI